jgi:arylsulfatase A-like enzyme
VDHHRHRLCDHQLKARAELARSLRNSSIRRPRLGFDLPPCIDTVVYDADDQRKKLPSYRVDALTDAATRCCDDHQEKPFFLFVSFLEPHHQNSTDDYPPPDGCREQMTANTWTPPDLATLKGTSTWHLGGYYGMVKRLDEAFGRLIDALKSLGMLDDTIVMFTSDHACHFKTRNSEYKRSCHESAVRVPTFITGPVSLPAVRFAPCSAQSMSLRRCWMLQGLSCPRR